MLSDKKYGLSVNLMATRVMPSLLPQTVNPSLNLDQFTNLLEVLQEMLDHIDRYVSMGRLRSGSIDRLMDIQ
jgi:SCY1-like protein 2